MSSFPPGNYNMIEWEYIMCSVINVNASIATQMWRIISEYVHMLFSGMAVLIKKDIGQKQQQQQAN